MEHDIMYEVNGMDNLISFFHIVASCFFFYRPRCSVPLPSLSLVLTVFWLVERPERMLEADVYYVDLLICVVPHPDANAERQIIIIRPN